MVKQPYTEVVEEDPLLDERMGSSAEREIVTEESEEHDVAVIRPKRRWWYFGGTEMPKRILTIVLVVLLIAVLVYAYRRYTATTLGNGNVVADDTTPRVVPEAGSYTVTEKKTEPKPIERAAAATAAVVNDVADTVTAPSTSTAMMPARDSVNPNPANGTVFSGTGKFQVYRQGNLTWRVDTDSGHTCILFATEEEWRKPIVYTHGCANS